MKAEEIRSVGVSLKDLVRLNEPGAYEHATVTALFEIAEQLARYNERDESKKWIPPSMQEGVFTSQILDILGAPTSGGDGSLNIQERVAWLLNKRDGVKV